MCLYCCFLSVNKHKGCVDHLAASRAMKMGQRKLCFVGQSRSQLSRSVRWRAWVQSDGWVWESDARPAMREEQDPSLFEGDKRPCCTKSFYRAKLCELGKHLIKIHAFCMFYGSSQHEEAAFTSRFIWNGWTLMNIVCAFAKNVTTINY